MYYLFVYGLLRSCNKTNQVKKIKSSADFCFNTTLHKHALFINHNGLVPTIYKTDDDDDYVIGELYCCFDKLTFDSMIGFIDTFVGNKFKKISVNVNNGTERVSAYTYISNDLDDFTYCEYHDYYNYLQNEHNLILQN